MGYQVSRINSEQPGQREAGEITMRSATLVQRIKSVLEQNDIIKVHVGCGPRILKDWINIDLKYTPYENYLKYYGDKYYPKEIIGDKSDLYIFDVTKRGLPLPDNSVNVIFHEDFIEHLDQKGQIIFLAEALRVLKKGAIHRINTPNLIISMRDDSNFLKGASGVYIDEWNKHKHLNVFTHSLLRELALLIGYSKVIFNGRDQSISKLIPIEYRPAPTSRCRSRHRNIFADLIK